MFRKFNFERYSLLFLLLLSTWLISSCQTPSIEFQLRQTEATEKQETYTVQVDNCGGFIPKWHTYRYPYIGNTVGVENLRPNGGEPFKSVAKRIWRMYGDQAEKLRPRVPAATKREFTLLVTETEYRGIVSGEVIDKNKIIPGQDAVYFYPFTQHIEIDSYQDQPCP